MSFNELLVAHKADEHAQEVLARDSGWRQRGQALILDTRSAAVSAHLIVHDPNDDTWGRTYLTDKDTGDLAVDDLSRRAWTRGYFSAAAAANDCEELVRLTASAPTVPR